MKPFLLMLLFFLLVPIPASAGPTISCHCFRDRSFDPARPAAADPYLLATTQNSLIAAVFDLNKRELVQAKMTGTPGDDLWVAHYLAQRSGLPASELLDAYERSGSWKSAATGIEKTRLGPRFAALLEANAPGEALAAVAADEIVTTRLGVKPEAVEQIRARGGSNAELILAAYLARKGSRSPVDIYTEVSSGNATWGQILSKVGGTASLIGEDVLRFTGKEKSGV